MTHAPVVGGDYSVVCPVCFTTVSFRCTSPLVYGVPCTACRSLIDLRTAGATLPDRDPCTLASGGDAGSTAFGSSVGNGSSAPPPVLYSSEVEATSGGAAASAQINMVVMEVEKEKAKVMPKQLTGEATQAFSAQRSQAMAERFSFFFPVTYAIEYLVFGNKPDAVLGKVRIFRKRIPFLGHRNIPVPHTSTSYAAPSTYTFFSILGFHWFCRCVVAQPWIFPYLMAENVLVFFFYFLLFQLIYDDPGYIRPGYVGGSNRESDEITLKDMVNNQKESLWENVNGVPMERKWCSTCEMHRPVRAAHCYLCGLCCYDHDHHCTVIGACVGRRRVEKFTFFVSTAALSCVMPALCFYTSMYLYGSTLPQTQLVLSVLLFIPCTFFSVMLSGTAVSMWYSLLSEASTRERIQAVYAMKRNPFSRGMLRNLIYHLFTRKVPPSLFTDEFVKEVATRYAAREQKGSGVTVTCS